MGEVRNPIKKTSIEKKNKIIEKGFELMCNKGYYNVNCADIAKYAGVSTGIIYQYFNDKMDIFLEGTKLFADKIMFPMLYIIDTNDFKIDNLDNVISKLIDSFIKEHTIKKQPHEELVAMSHINENVAALFNKTEEVLTNRLAEVLIKNGFNKNNIKEKIRISMGLIDNYSHEVVYNRHNNIDYNIMKEKVIKTIIFLLKGDNDEKI